MIKSSLHLTFVLQYKSTYCRVSYRKGKISGGYFVIFNEFLILPLFNCCFFLPRNFPVIRENGDYFTVILGLFKLFV